MKTTINVDWREWRNWRDPHGEGVIGYLNRLLNPHGVSVSSDIENRLHDDIQLTAESNADVLTEEPKCERIIIPAVENCARCGLIHHDLMFERFEHQAGEMTHWAECPHTLQPILLKIVNEGTQYARIAS